MTGVVLRVRSARLPSEHQQKKLAAAFGEEYIASLWVPCAESRCESLAAAALLYDVLRAMGEKPRRVARNACGKPVFVGADDLFFSLSHDRGAVCAAVAREPIGADLMRLPPTVPPEKQARLCARFLPPSASVSGRSFDENWTRFEAYSKLLGGNLSDVFRTEAPPEAEFETVRRRLSGGPVTVTLCRRRKND